MDGKCRIRAPLLAAFFFLGPLFRVFSADVPLVWRQPLSGNVISEISARLQSIVAVCEGGSVRAFGASGAPLWDYKVPGRFLPFLGRSRSAASYLCRTNGEFIALSRTGLVQWRLNLSGPIVAPPLSGWDERVFIFLSKKIVCLSASGHTLWQRELSAPLAGETALDRRGGVITVLEDNTLLFVSPFGEVSQIKLYEAPRFILPIPPEQRAGVSRAKEGENENGERVLLIYGDGRLEAYTMAGKASGNLTHLGAAPVAAAAFKSYAVVQLSTGFLAALDVDKGAVRWKSPSMPGVGAAGNRAQRPLIQFDEEEGLIYLLSITGAAAFKFDGTELWNTRLENAAVTPAFDEGALYSGGRDWILYAYKAEARPDPPPRASLPALGRYGLGQGPSRREWTDFSERYDFEYETLLRQMEKSILSGGLGEEEPVVVRSLIGIVSDKQTILTERVEAARLLGLIGSTETTPFLARRLLAESDGTVQTEIVLALGRIGVDPQGRVLDVFQRLIERQRPVIQNEPLFLAIAAALGNMCRFSGPPVSERGVRLLVMLANENSSSAVHEKARRELESLR